MQPYKIGENVAVDWMGFDGPEIIEGTVLNIYDDEIEVCVYRQGDWMECTFEPYRVHKLRHFSIMGDK